MRCLTLIKFAKGALKLGAAVLLFAIIGGVSLVGILDGNPHSLLTSSSGHIWILAGGGLTLAMGSDYMIAISLFEASDCREFMRSLATIIGAQTSLTLLAAWLCQMGPFAEPSRRWWEFVAYGLGILLVWSGGALMWAGKRAMSRLLGESC